MAHIKLALDLKTPFAHAIALPSDVSEAIEAVNVVSNEQMIDFWKRRIDTIRSTKQSIANANREWYDSTPDIIRKATGVIDIPLWSYLIRAFDMGNPLWATQFDFGFPIVCHLSQNRLYASKPISEEDISSAGSIDNLYLTANKRFFRAIPPS